MHVDLIEVGLLSTNCYIVYENQKCVLIDPGADAGMICRRIEELGVTPCAILLTHGHFDHIGAVEAIAGKYPDIKIYAGKDEDALLHDARLNCTERVGRPCTVNADILVEDGQVFTEADIEFRVIKTPGHTLGSVCYFISKEGILFAGDTLFQGSIGRTDLPTGDEAALFRSLGRLKMLPDETIVYSGHGQSTSIGVEKRINPFISM